MKSIEFYLYLKNWIDAVQWHMEGIIRNPAIEPTEGLVTNDGLTNPIKIVRIWLS